MKIRGMLRSSEAIVFGGLFASYAAGAATYRASGDNYALGAGATFATLFASFAIDRWLNGPNCSNSPNGSEEKNKNPPQEQESERYG